MLPHKCDERCVCPIDGKPLYYARSINEHACQSIDCRYAHGMESVQRAEFWGSVFHVEAKGSLS